MPNARYFTLVDVKPGARGASTPNQQQEEALRDYHISLDHPISSFRMHDGANIDRIHITLEDARAIEVATRQQRKCPAWFRHRKGLITASNFKAVCRSKTAKHSALINKILRPMQVNTAATQYGIENENLAKERALAALQQSHRNGRLEECGLMISPEHPFLGCSPDGVFRCDCHEPALLEVKCLYNLRDANPASIVAEGQKEKTFCLDNHGNLKENHQYYYQVQAQLHLNLLGCSLCYLYLHVEKGGIILAIEKNLEFMETNKNTLKHFFQTVILPRISTDY